MEKWHDHLLKGVIWIIIGTLAFALMSTCVKEIGDGASVWMIIFFRFAFATLALTPWFLKDIKKTVCCPCPWLLLGRAAAALSSMAIFFAVIRVIPMINAILLVNTAPLFVPLLVRLLLGYKTPQSVYWGILIGFVGIILVLRPGTDIFHWGALVGLISGLLAGLAIVILRLVGQKADLRQIFFFYFFVSMVVGGILSLFNWQPLTLRNFYYLLAVGFFGLIYQIGLTKALRVAPARLMGSFLFMGVVFGGILDWLVFAHVPPTLTFLGMGLVALGSIIAIVFGRKRIIHHPHHKPKE